MESNGGMNAEFSRALDELAALRQFSGEPKNFWPAFLNAAAKLVSADIAVLLLGHPGKTPRWAKIGEWNSGSGLSRVRTQFTSQLEQTAERGLGGGFVELTDAASGSSAPTQTREPPSRPARAHAR
jgi:hypothetical protein